VSRLAVGNPNLPPTAETFHLAADYSQDDRIDGLPFGTRGGTLIEHNFPSDGDYTIRIFAVTLGNMGNFRPFGEVRGEQLEVLVDGERVAGVRADLAGGRSGTFYASPGGVSMVSAATVPPGRG